MKNSGKNFCTTQEAAKLLSVSVRTVQLWVENGLLLAWKTPGGHRRVIRESIEKLLRAKPSDSAPNVAQNSPFKILILEDDLILLRLYKVMLSEWAMQPTVIGVSNGIEALLLIERERPDMLMLDLTMPGIDGFQMLRILKSNPEHADMAIVVISGLSDTEVDKKGGIPAGIPMLPKPIPFSTLQAMTMMVIQGRKNRQ